MLENISDYLSLFILIALVIAGIYFLFVVTDRNHHDAMIKRENRYYSFYENMDDEFDDERDSPYYE